MHSADRVLPEYQHPQVGDGFCYGSNKMSFKIVEPEHVLATQSADERRRVLRESRRRTDHLHGRRLDGCTRATSPLTMPGASAPRSASTGTRRPSTSSSSAAGWTSNWSTVATTR
jgi:hypothetical protein